VNRKTNFEQELLINKILKSTSNVIEVTLGFDKISVNTINPDFYIEMKNINRIFG
jgi:hypothetical protein